MNLERIVTNKYKIAAIIVLTLLINAVAIGFIIPEKSHAKSNNTDIYSKTSNRYNELQEKYNILQYKYQKLEEEHKETLDQLSTEKKKNKKLRKEKNNNKTKTTNTNVTAVTTSVNSTAPTSNHLTALNGVYNGPSGKETYYNLPMDGVINLMRNEGYSANDYPYWIQSNGCKMFGQYIMVAADLSIRPKGTILETSLGTAMVVDTGDFAQMDNTQIDIAISW